jgi:hypothetical protein
MNRKVVQVAYWILRTGFGILLVAASVDKLIHPHLFADAVANYRVTGQELALWVAVWIPCLELLTGLFLITGIWPDASISVNSILMTAFLILVIQAYARHLDIACGCFRLRSTGVIGPGKVAENVLMALFSWILLILYFRFERKRVSG